jgi:hypothetical protein
MIALFCQYSLSYSADIKVRIVSNDDLAKKYKGIVKEFNRHTSIIFLPGVLGSKLVDLTNQATPEVVWGGTDFDNPKLAYDLKSNLVSYPFLANELKLLGKHLKYDVYGSAVSVIRQNNTKRKNTDIELFHYDWRRSNYESAEIFNDWMCNREEKIDDNNIVFVAHSMGGLVLKHWFINYFDKQKTCIKQENIMKIVFVGTPHYGSSLTIDFLFNGYSFGLPVEVIDSYVSEGLTKFGYTFPSFYEMMPVQNNKDCVVANVNLAVSTALKIEGMKDDETINMFSPDTFRDFELPRHLSVEERTVFVRDTLPPILEKAKFYTCGLANYDFPKSLIQKAAHDIKPLRGALT